MYLKNLSIRGFKTFADKTALNFEPSPHITAIVGPNGCGKSNIIDALRFVIGEQSVKEMRGEELEHVIFAGSSTRKPLSLAEVSILIDNSDFKIKTDYSEIFIKRRIFRSGESEFFINKNSCRLKDIKDLFLDTGIGDGAYSIINQGQVDSILSSKPQDRRAIFEEAAAIGKYKFRKRSAERRLIATEQNLLRVNDLKGEISDSIQVLEKQAEKAKEYQEIKDKLRTLEIGLAKKQIKLINERKTSALEKINDLKDKTSGVEVNYAKEEEEHAELKKIINAQENRMEEIRNEINSLRTQYEETKRKISVGNERAAQLLERKEELIKNSDREVQNHSLKLSRISEKKSELDTYKEQYGESNKYLDFAQKTLEEINKKIENSIRGWNNLKNPIFEREMEISSKKHSISEIDLAIKYASENLAKDTAFLDNLSGFKEDIEVLEKEVMALVGISDDLKGRISSRKNSISKKIDIEISQILKNIEEQKSEISKICEKKDKETESLNKLEQNAGEMNDQYLSLENKMKELTQEKEKAIATLAEARAIFANYETNYKFKKSETDEIEAEIKRQDEDLKNKKAEITAILERIARTKDEIDENEKALPAYAEKESKLTKTLADIAEKKAKDQNKLDVLEEKIRSISFDDRALRDLLTREEISFARIESELEMVLSFMKEDYQLDIAGIEENEIPPAANSVKSKEEIESSKEKLREIGPVNLLAVTEFNAQKERFSFIENQYADLVSARDNLNSLIRGLDDEAKSKFLDTISIVNNYFTEIFGTLFEGGEGKIALGEGDPLEAGIEIMAKIAGKKWLNLMLMSGGEKALTAIAILFSLIKTNPSPFCFMDEVDAALDEINTLRFSKMLAEFSLNTQIVVVTHSKRTMSKVSSLYGVTMEEPGISKIVSMKLVKVAD